MKDNLKFSSIDVESYTPVSSEEKLLRNYNIMGWGIKNDFPDYLYYIYSSCSTLQSIINGSIDFTMGNGIINNTKFTGLNRNGDTLEEVVEKLIYDRWIFGGFAFQVIYNTFGEVIEIDYIDFRKCRLDKSGNTVYVSDDWKGWGKSRALQFNTYKPNDKQKAIEDGIQIFYYKGKKTRGYYPICDYNAALISAEIQIEIQNFQYNELQNNFIGSAVINFNNGEPTQEVKEAIERGIIDKFAGTSNAARIFLSFNQDKEKAVTVEKLNDDNLDTRYESLSESSREDLFISLRANPILFGLPASTGFADQNFSEAYELYNRISIVPKQKEIINVIDKIFGKNSISIIPFTVQSTEEKVAEINNN